MELTHTPLAVAGIMACWARWLELRLNPGENPTARQVSGWVWPVCILFCGLLLLGYREA
jgi:putative copper resistance protein D